MSSHGMSDRSSCVRVIGLLRSAALDARNRRGARHRRSRRRVGPPPRGDSRRPGRQDAGRDGAAQRLATRHPRSADPRVRRGGARRRGQGIGASGASRNNLLSRDAGPDRAQAGGRCPCPILTVQEGELLFVVSKSGDATGPKGAWGYVDSDGRLLSSRAAAQDRPIGRFENGLFIVGGEEVGRLV